MVGTLLEGARRDGTQRVLESRSFDGKQQRASKPEPRSITGAGRQRTSPENQGEVFFS